MNKLILLLGFFLIISCSKNTESDVVDVGIDLKLEDRLGNDLLDPDINNSYNNYNIKLFHLQDGVEQYYYCGSCDHKKGYYFFERDGKYVVRISTNFEIQQDSSDLITYIQWNETDRDTIQRYIERNKDGSSIVCTKVWYNDELIYDHHGERYFTIIKDE